ncbi:MAG: hypothetical protein II969_05410 [Anaerolineaceae bacterium]|nr:hypothetical protein [Anaerolineaceae bacterium]
MRALKFLFPAIIISLLCGCSTIKERVTQALWNYSGITEDPAYIQYVELEKGNELNQEGVYHSEIVDEYLAEEDKPSGSIQVSFARSEFLQMEYYRDAEMNEKLDTENCWLNPGDTIYVSEVKLSNTINPFYHFSEIRVRQIDEKGNAEILSVVTEVPGLLYHIPEDFSGTDISIVPIGTYQNRIVNLNAVYVKPDGTETVMENGIWQINGKRHGNGPVELNPMESYRVVFDYSAYKDNWYFAGSSPEAYWDNDNEAIISFLTVPSNSEQMDFTVRLHPYGTMTVLNGLTYQNPLNSIIDSAAALFGNKSIIETQNIIELIQVNGITSINNFSDTEIKLSDLKTGDEILIRVPEMYKVIAEGLQLPASEHKEKSSREYRFTIPDSEAMTFRLSVTQRNSNLDGIYHTMPVTNGELALYDASGVRYSDGSELPAENEKIAVTIVPDAQYCIYGRNVKDNIYQAEMTYSDFNKNLQTILTDHPIRPGIVVTIDTEDDRGNCTFWSGNEMLTGTVYLREGQDLQFDYLLDPEGGYEIILSKEEREQMINVWSPYAASRYIEVNDNLQGKTLRCRDFVTMQERVGENVAANTY